MQDLESKGNIVLTVNFYSHLEDSVVYGNPRPHNLYFCWYQIDNVTCDTPKEIILLMFSLSIGGTDQPWIASNSNLQYMQLVSPGNSVLGPKLASLAIPTSPFSPQSSSTLRLKNL